MDILRRAPPPTDHRLPYGPGPLQFGDLSLPPARPGERLPVAVFLHGGWLEPGFHRNSGGHLCAALKSQGVATWSIEYRRACDPGGGWPGTFHDVAAGFDYLQDLAHAYPLDLHRVVVTGHSAGAHLAFWLAGRHHIPHTSPLYDPQPVVPITALVALAGAVDLRLTVELSGTCRFATGKPAVLSLIGGCPAAMSQRYDAANPGDLLPLAVPQFLLQGADDDQIPPTLPDRWAENARRQGDHVTVLRIPGADHFDLVDPESKAWPVVQNAILASLGISRT